MPLGYNDADGKLVPVDEELMVVSEIKALRDDGLRISKINYVLDFHIELKPLHVHMTIR